MNPALHQEEDESPYQTLDINQLLHQRGYEIENFYRLSELVNAGLGKEVIAIVIDLIEKGIHPESIAEGNSQQNFCLKFSNRSFSLVLVISLMGNSKKG
jgi:hypothetical protein